MLSESQLAMYREDGYVIPDFRLPADVLAEIGAAHDRLMVKHPEFRDLCPTVLAYDTGFLNFAREPEILDMVGQILGPDFALWNSSFFAKPAHNGLRTPWHQDGEYWPIRPLATCTVWIAVDDTTVENGCLRVIKGSHKLRDLRPHRTVAGTDVTLNEELVEVDESRIVDLVLKAGQISLHDVFLCHGSEANTSPKPRRGFTLRFMPTTSRLDRELAVDQYKRMGKANHAERTLYLMRGTDACGQNDFTMRH